jgi:nucleoprotein TPR
VQFSSASSTHNASSVELGNLKTRIEDVEREKRDLVGVISRLKEDCAQRDGMDHAAIGALHAHISL